MPLELKSTINLPKTDFPMKANLPQNEPKALARWEQMRIYERIREEVRAGKAASAAVDQGFAHAWVTIVDTHVTTIVSAAILFIFGSGPVKGFATTLTFGLLANLFTAVFVSRVIFDAHLNKMKPGEMVSI